MFRAIIKLLKGEKPNPLFVWMDATEELVKDVLKQAEKHGLDTAARTDYTLTIEGRIQNMETILSGVLYHMQHEYTYILRNPTEHGMTAIYAINMNDQYNVGRLAEEDTPIRDALLTLSQHLNSIPKI